MDMKKAILAVCSAFVFVCLCLLSPLHASASGLGMGTLQWQGGVGEISMKVKAPSKGKLKWTNSASVRDAAVKMTVKLKINKKKNSKVLWHSSNKKVATVSSDGKVTFKKRGTVTITCRLKNSKNKVKCRFTVKKRAKKLVLSDKSKEVLPVGKTCARTASVLPAGAYGGVKWSSSNKKVASVSSDGTVLAKKKGTAVITATLKDGSKKKVKYSVKVIGRITQGSTKFIAHRGYSSEAPENTAAAFELAGQAGFWGAECDVQMTRDGKFVVMHDASCLRMCGIDRKVSDMTYAQVTSAPIISGSNLSKYPKEHPASLSDFLNICRRYHMVPFVEIKMAYNQAAEGGTLAYPAKDTLYGQALPSVDGSTLERLYKEVKSIMGRNPCVFIAFDYNNLIKLKSLKDSDPSGGNVTFQHLSGSLETLGTYPYLQDHIGLAIYHAALAPAQVPGVAGQGIPVNVWTVDNAGKTLKYVKAGVQYITTRVKVWQ